MTTICQAEVRAIFVAKTVRTFCYGFLGIALPVYLSELGLTAAGLGVAVTLTLAGSALLTWLVRRPAERYGGRPAPVALRALSALAAVVRPSSPHPRPGVRRRLRAPVAGRLLPPRTLRPRSRGPRRGLLRHASPHGRLAAARRPRGRALRAPRDDGGLAPGVQRGADPHRVGAHGRGRDRAPVRASPALADGRADPAGVRDGPRRGPRARGGGDHHQHCADRRPGGHARADGVGDAGRGARGAVRGGRRSEDRLRPAALLDLQRRQAEARRVRGSRGSSSGGGGEYLSRPVTSGG